MRGDAIINHNGKALPTHPHAESAGIEFQSESARVLAIAVGEHDDLLANTSILTPCIHDEYVVDCHTGNCVDTFCGQLFGLINKARKVVQRTSWRKSAGYRNENHFFSRE